MLVLPSDTYQRLSHPVLVPGSRDPLILKSLFFGLRTPLEKSGDKPELIKLISGLRAATQAVGWNVFAFQLWL